MSLARLAMRIAAARAVRGTTLADARVYDSSIDPIDIAVQENRQPFLVVYTDDHESEIAGRDLFYGEHTCDLVIEAAIASRVEIPGDVGIDIPHTDEGMELVLDIIEHQIMAALVRERTEWSRIWMKLVPRIRRRQSKRGASAEGGVRFAARQIILSCDLVEAPIDGISVLTASTWSDVLSVMESDTTLAPIADLLRATIEGPEAVAQWKRDANAVGITQAAANALAIGGEFVITGDMQGPPNDP